MAAKEIFVVVCLFGLLVPTACYVLLTFFTLTWNAVMPQVFKLPEITKGQSFALMILTVILGALFSLTSGLSTDLLPIQHELQEIRNELGKLRQGAPPVGLPAVKP